MSLFGTARYTVFCPVEGIRMKRVSLWALLFAVSACSTYGNGYMSPSSSGTGTVTLGAGSFVPGTVYPTDADSTVTWTWNSGGVVHNITFEDTTIVGATDRSTGSFNLKFTVAGTYRFRCTHHSTSFTNGMIGKVVFPNPGTGTGGGGGGCGYGCSNAGG
jgi:plastocyanin